MNNNLQLVLKSSTTEMSLNDHDAGIYIVPELDGLTGLPEIRTTSGVNAGYDGGWTSAQKFDARSIVIRGVIANEDKTEVERMRRELVALLAQGKNEQLELDFVTETGRAYEVQVRTIACDMAMQRVLTQQEFMITLRADDPLIYDNSSAGEEATVNISGATGGFRIPFEIPLAIDAGSEETVVQNSGLESVAPTIKMYGALHNPKIINHTTNQAMQVEAELGFAEGAWTTPVDAPEGTNVSFEPEREAPIESAKLKGNTSQQTYTGKNLLNLYSKYAIGSSTTINGVTYTLQEDGGIKMKGTAGSTNSNLEFIGTGWDSTTVQVALNSGSAYMSSINRPSSAYRWYVRGLVNGSATSINSNNNQTTISNCSGITYAMLQVTPNTTVDGVVYPMVELGSSVTSFEPYVGGVPAPNPDYPQAVQVVTGENTVKICGKNLLYLSGLNATDNGVANTLNNDDSITCSGTVGSGWNGWTIMPYVSNSIQAGTYALSIDHAINVGINITFRDSSNTNIVAGNIPAGSTSATITLPRTAAKYSLWANGTTGTAISFTIKAQLVAGSTPDYNYEPYQEQSYEVNLGNIELCKIGVYQDYIYKSGDKWYVHKAINQENLDGSGTWTAGGAGGVYIWRAPASALVMPSASSVVADIVCSHLKGVTFSDIYYARDTGVAVPSNGQRICVSVMTDVATTIAWLDANTPAVYYALATPTDTEITNEALIEQLEALVDGNAVVYEGATNIAVIAAEGDMPGITAIRYYTDKEPDQRDELIIDSRLKTITLNGLDVYHLKTEGSEFPMLAPGENKLSLQSDIVGDNGYAKVSYKQGYLSI